MQYPAIWIHFSIFGHQLLLGEKKKKPVSIQHPSLQSACIIINKAQVNPKNEKSAYLGTFADQAAMTGDNGECTGDDPPKHSFTRALHPAPIICLGLWCLVILHLSDAFIQNDLFRL